MAVRIVQYGHIVQSAQSPGDFLCENVHIYGGVPLHRATFVNGNTAAICLEFKSAEIYYGVSRICCKYEIRSARVSTLRRAAPCRATSARIASGDRPWLAGSAAPWPLP